ncbi:MAG: hypothetical protein LQ342_001569 [Letrouitia transgressa]|nr:MAG: hypothetical protein LQ342_001569 [Letrouitia transgressa]
MACKIITIGPVEGKFLAAFEKISKLHSKNSFSSAIVLGDLFADPAVSSPEHDEDVDSLVHGKVTVPLPMYFTIGKHALPKPVIEKLESSSDEICPNLYFLGKRSTTKTSEGLRIVSIGGSLDAEITAGLSKDKYLPFHTEDDAKALRGANTADILISSHWPSDIRSGSKVHFPSTSEAPVAEQCISDLSSALRPRYHFSSSGNAFYEREPFFHLPLENDPEVRPVTRFISLAAFDNLARQKYLYAFSIDPSASVPITLPPGTTVSPFTSLARKRQRSPGQSESYSRFDSQNGGDRSSYRPNKRPRHNRQKAPPPGPQDCFFCLSNPNLSTHLITSIANDTYLTIAKGPLPTPTTYTSLPCPTHMLIIPLPHSPTLTSILEPDVRASTYKEMHRYRRALHSLLISKSGQALGSVTWEVSRKAGIHTHWQFMPVATELVKKGLVEAAFKVEAENEKYPAFRNKEVGAGAGESGDFFRVWIWMPGEDEKLVNAERDGPDQGGGEESFEERGKQKSLMLPITPEVRFDLQFGRKVMAKLLGLEKRMQWRDCAQTDEEEMKDAQAFKEIFRSFDFSLE